MKDIVAIYSGGMDSFTMVGLYRSRIHTCLSFNYGQRHKKELAYAAMVCAGWDIPHHIVELQCLQSLVPNSALTGDTPMPEGHYAEESMKQTVVPNRNMIMLSMAAAYAMSHKLKAVYFGAHSGDHTIYPDCRPEFVSALDEAVRLADWHPLSIRAPFIGLDKGDIVKAGLDLDLDYSLSWTCYKGGELACGVCGSCQERLEAFNENGVEDPLNYETRVLLPKEDDREE